jgi:hypothetical protein
MIERVDFLVALVAIVVTLVGSQTALWLAIQQKADKADLNRLEAKFDSFTAALERKADKEDLARIEAKLDTLLLRLMPETPRSS